MNAIERLIKALHSFKDANISFVLIGGLAMIAHGANILTQDVDLAYAVDADNTERLARFLASIHARVLGRPVTDTFTITPEVLARVRFLNLFTDLGEVDVMRELPGVESFAGIYERAVALDLGGFVVHVASLDDLIAMKRAANRPKDQNHVHELLALQKLIAEAKHEAN